jgi:hypothetical protein
MSTTKRTVLVVGITLLGILAISALYQVDAVELTEEDFVPLATQGFLTAVDGPHPEGSRRNSYMWSMRWWNDKLYVGTVRDVLCWRGGGRPPGVCNRMPAAGDAHPGSAGRDLGIHPPGGGWHCWHMAKSVPVTDDSFRFGSNPPGHRVP